MVLDTVFADGVGGRLQLRTMRAIVHPQCRDGFPVPKSEEKLWIKGYLSATTFENNHICPIMTKITAADHQVGGCFYLFDKLEFTYLILLKISSAETP